MQETEQAYQALNSSQLDLFGYKVKDILKIN